MTQDQFKSWLEGVLESNQEIVKDNQLLSLIQDKLSKVVAYPPISTPSVTSSWLQTTPAPYTLTYTK